MKTILAAVDFSPISARVVAAARRLGRLTGAEVVVAHVVPPPVYAADLSGLALVDFSALTTAAREASNQELARLRRQSKGAVRVLPAEVGPPAPLLLRHARRLRAGCIVLGSHGHGLLHDLAVGSIARGILKRATCPVLVVPATPPARAQSRR